MLTVVMIVDIVERKTDSQLIMGFLAFVNRGTWALVSVF